MIIGIVFWVSVGLILYVYAGYPILIALLAQLRKPPEFESVDQPSMTLIFAAYNEEILIAQKIENCLGLNYPSEKLQILVANDGSTDRTAEIVLLYQGRGVELVNFHQRRGKLSAIKDTLEHACGELILFSDADNLYAPDTLLEVVKYFSDPRVGAVSGGRNVIGMTSLGVAESLYWKYEEFIKLQESRIGSCVGVAGDLLAIRKRLFISPPNGIINDDFYMALSIVKQGYRVVYAPNARSFHPVAKSEQEEVERRARMVAGRYQALFSAWKLLPFENPIALWQVISHKYLRPLVPFAMILAFVATIFSLTVIENGRSFNWLVLSYPINWILLILQLGFYFTAVFGMKYKVGGWIGKAVYLPTFLVNSNLAALLGLYRFISSKQSVVWNKVTR